MDLNENWEIKIDDVFYKQIRQFPKYAADQIIKVIEDPSFNPYFGDIKKIKNELNVWRRRINAYRIFYEINQHYRVVHIFWVERRNSKTYSR